jgi:hypothetical protein
MVIARNVQYVCCSKTRGLSNDVQFYNVLTSLVSKGKRMFRIKLIIITQDNISFQKFVVTQMNKKFPAFIEPGSFIIVTSYIFRGGNLFLLNVGSLSTDCIVLYPRTLHNHRCENLKSFVIVLTSTGSTPRLISRTSVLILSTYLPPNLLNTFFPSAFQTTFVGI